MLSKTLETIRRLTDEAFAADEAQHATSLSKASSTLHNADRYREHLISDRLSVDEVHQLYSQLVEDYLAVAREQLTAEQYEHVEWLKLDALPQQKPTNTEVARLTREFEQVESLFEQAVEGKLVTEAVRLANLLAQKCKSLTRMQIDAGEFLTAGDMRPIKAALLDANDAIKTVLGEEEFCKFVDAFMAQYKAA